MGQSCPRCGAEVSGGRESPLVTWYVGACVAIFGPLGMLTVAYAVATLLR